MKIFYKGCGSPNLCNLKDRPSLKKTQTNKTITERLTTVHLLLKRLYWPCLTVAINYFKKYK